MIAEEIRHYTVRAAEDASRNESQVCPSGVADLLTLVGEIAAQLASFNQTFEDLKRQIAGGYIRVATFSEHPEEPLKNPPHTPKIVAIKGKGKA